ncbi:MAG: ZIP family metal transporter [Oscillospiraceae bacterium]|nr:ZIP family metal transporter [Oscillospiraceae bacterium]
MLDELTWAAAGTGFIFIMSLLGASAVLFMPGEVKLGQRAVLMGFTAGVMTAASVWSLLIPAMEQQTDSGTLPCWFPALLGLFLGAVFLFSLDAAIFRRRKFAALDPSAAMLVSSITLHNIPEGMAVGLAFALAADGESFAAACALSLGIGVQNLPEGAAVSLPLRQFGLSRGRAFAVGLLSAAVEPLFGIGAVLIAGLVHPLMPWFLSFAAGAMLYVTAHELLPEARGGLGSFSFIGGFALMMVLDVALG